MTTHHSLDPSRRRSGFHDGELAVQTAAGVRRAAARLEQMLDSAQLGEGTAGWLAQQTFAAMTARDDRGRLWTSPLIGPPGFLRAVDSAAILIGAAPAVGDPLHTVASGQFIGLVVIDYKRRRRFRLNGALARRDAGQLLVTVDEAYGNCPQFIPQRTITAPPVTELAGDGVVAVPATWGDRVDSGVVSAGLTDADRATITASDTFVLGTTHPERGNDASHRGGPPGFVRTAGDDVWWPDYRGNNLFNSLGNLHADPEAALLFLDFATGSALHLHGTAELTTVEPGSPGDDGRTGRRVTFHTRRRTRSRLAAHSELVSQYPRNPPVTDR